MWIIRIILLFIFETPAANSNNFIFAHDEKRQDFSTFLPSHFWPVLSFEASFERGLWSAPAISCTADSSIPRSFLRYLMHLNKHCNFHIQACKMHNNNIMSCNTGPHHISIANITLLPRTHYKASIND